MYDERFVCGQGRNGRFVCMEPIRIEGDSKEAVYEQWSTIVAEIDEVLGRRATYRELRDGGIAHEDARTDREREADRLTREADLRVEPVQKTTKQLYLEHLEQRDEQDRLSKMTPLQRELHRARKEREAEKAEESQAVAEAAMRATHEVAQALSDATLTAIVAGFDVSLTQAEVEQAKHRQVLLERSYDVGQYNFTKQEWAKVIAARSAESAAEAERIFKQRLKQSTRYLPPEPPAGTPPEPPKPLFDKPAEFAGADKFKRPLVKVHFNGGSATISKTAFEQFVGDDAGLRDWVADESNHVEPGE